MYFLTVIITLAILAIFTFSSAGMQRIIYVIDSPSLMLSLLICIPILVSCGLHKDFISAFRLTFSRQADASLREKKRAQAAVSLVMKTLLLAGGLNTVYYLILVFADSANNSNVTGSFILANLSVCFISLFYALFLNLFLLLIYGKLETMISDYSYPDGHPDNSCPAGRRPSGEKVHPSGYPDNSCPAGRRPSGEKV